MGILIRDTFFLLDVVDLILVVEIRDSLAGTRHSRDPGRQEVEVEVLWGQEGAHNRLRGLFDVAEHGPGTACKNKTSMLKL